MAERWRDLNVSGNSLIDSLVDPQHMRLFVSNRDILINPAIGRERKSSGATTFVSQWKNYDIRLPGAMAAWPSRPCESSGASTCNFNVQEASSEHDSLSLEPEVSNPHPRTAQIASMKDLEHNAMAVRVSNISATCDVQILLDDFANFGHVLRHHCIQSTLCPTDKELLVQMADEQACEWILSCYDGTTQYSGSNRLSVEYVVPRGVE